MIRLSGLIFCAVTFSTMPCVSTRLFAANVQSGPYSSVAGTWSVIDDTGNCKSTITFQQAPDGAITAMSGSTSCQNGRVTGTQTGSSFEWVNAKTLRYDYRFTSKNSAALNDGSAEAVFQSETSGRLNARDNKGNTGTNRIQRTTAVAAAKPKPAFLQIGGTWSVIDDTGNCKSTITFQQAADGAIAAMNGSTSCENGRVTGTQAGSDFRWVSAKTLRYNYRFTSKSSSALNDGTAEVVFQSETSGRLNARDNKGNTGTNRIQRTTAVAAAKPKPAFLQIGGTWSVIDDTGNCKSTITFQQAADGAIAAMNGSTSCENGRVTGTQAGSDFRWVNAKTLRYNYRFTSKSSSALNDGSAEVVFQSESSGQLNARDNKGNAGANRIQRKTVGN